MLKVLQILKTKQAHTTQVFLVNLDQAKLQLGVNPKEEKFSSRVLRKFQYNESFPQPSLTNFHKTETAEHYLEIHANKQLFGCPHIPVWSVVPSASKNMPTRAYN